MLNKLGYIELYISKTRIYQSFSEVLCHLNQCKLPFIYQAVWNQLNLLSFVINTSKVMNISQFLDQHIPFIYQTHWKQSTFHSFAIERHRHCFYYSNSFMNDWREQWLDYFLQHRQYHVNKQGVTTETLCYINGSVNTIHKLINNEQYNANLAHLWYPWNEHSNTNSVISNFLYIKIFTYRVPWTSIYIRVLLYLFVCIPSNNNICILVLLWIYVRNIRYKADSKF